jgi:hypothetical protein
MSLLTTEIIHFTVTVLIATFIYYKFRSWKLVFLCLSAGMLIDADHFIDYFILTDFSPLNVYAVLNSSQYIQTGRTFLFFHGYEYVVLFFILAGGFKKWRPVFFTLGLAILGHLLVDQFTNNPAPFAYFIIYRWSKHFEFAKLFFPY